MSEKHEANIKDGKLNVMGVDVNISQTLGQMICSQYLSSISEEDMLKMLDFMDEDVFDKDKYTGVKAVRTRSGTYSYDNSLMDDVRREFGNLFKEELKTKLIARMESPEFKKRMESISDEIIEYAINGFKEDIASRIRSSLVGNLFSNDPVIPGSGESLYRIINNVIDARFRQ